MGGQDNVRPRLGWRKLYGTKGSSGSYYTVSALFKTLRKPRCMMNHCGKKLSEGAAHHNPATWHTGVCRGSVCSAAEHVPYPPGDSSLCLLMLMDSLS